MRDVLAIDCKEHELFWTTLKSDCRILFAETAKKGMNMLSENISLVFLSKRLSDMNGLETLSMIKKEYPSTAVIIITSCSTEEACIEAFRKGARDYMRKPLKQGEILEKIRILNNINNDSPGRQHIPLSKKSIYDDYPDIPAHLVSGVLKVRDFIAQNYSEALSLSAACKMASISKTNFCRFFRCITGQSLRNYHHWVRIKIAEELLRDKRLSVTEVAIRLGYNDSNYFSAIYKRITGISPRQQQASDQNPDKEKEDKNDNGISPNYADI